MVARSATSVKCRQHVDAVMGRSQVVVSAKSCCRRRRGSADSMSTQCRLVSVSDFPRLGILYTQSERLNILAESLSTLASSAAAS